MLGTLWIRAMACIELSLQFWSFDISYVSGVVAAEQRNYNNTRQVECIMAHDCINSAS